MFNCCSDAIGRISMGKTYYNSKFNYPIRKETIRAKSFDASNSITKKAVSTGNKLFIEY